MQVRACDRCKKFIDSSYEIPFHLSSTDIGTNTLCKPCVERLKRILVQFWKVRENTREQISNDFEASLPKGFHYIAQKQEPEKNERNIGRKPTNIFTKIFYKLFFEEVKSNEV